MQPTVGGLARLAKCGASFQACIATLGLPANELPSTISAHVPVTQNFKLSQAEGTGQV